MEILSKSFTPIAFPWWQLKEVLVLLDLDAIQPCDAWSALMVFPLLHEHFQWDLFAYFFYEITAKIAADIHTKGFENPMAWKKARRLINLLEPQDLASKEVLDMLQPSTDVDMTTRQVFQSKTDDIPNFPYTETPILPQEV